MEILTDKCCRLFLTVAYRLLRCYWYLFRPQTRGVYIAVWYQNQILIIKNSYKTYYTVPGGGINKDEQLNQAALRELREETGIELASDNIVLFCTINDNHEYKQDTVYFWEARVTEKPDIKVDQREVVTASFMNKNDLPNINLSPVVRKYIVIKEQGHVP